MKKWMGLGVALLVGFFPVLASALPLVDVEAAATAWMESPSGKFGYNGTLLDLESDLGFDSESRFGGRVKVDFPILPEISLMGTRQSYDETATLSRTIDFGNQTFTASGKINTKLEMDHIDAAVAFGIPFLETATLDRLSVKLGVNVRLYQFKAEMSEATTGKTDEKSLDLPLPMLYGFVRFSPIEALSFEAEGRGLAINDNMVTSLIGRVRYQAFGPAFVAAGYRSDTLDVDEEGIRIDTTFAGPFVEAGLRF